MVTYREATAQDTAALLDLLREIMAHHGVPAPGDKHLVAVVQQVLAAPHHVFLVAEVEGAVVGMCNLIFSFSTWSAAPVCEVQDLVVTKSFRRQGIGRGLLEAAARMARTRGCRRLFLLAEVWNLEAHRFYRAAGMSEKTCLYFEQDLPPGS
ncbi:MAG: GNAT family N-acetyltransferase [Thermoleophilia bacterium]|nr:GNAT family N-acetyltransferase [Thermoleophilia bacterium]